MNMAFCRCLCNRNPLCDGSFAKACFKNYWMSI